MLIPLIQILRALLLGVWDAVSIHSSLLFFLTSRHVRVLTLQCLVLNGFIFLGSFFVVRQVLSPLMYTLLANNESDSLNKAGALMGFTITWMYELLWIYPIYCISFILNAVWYQDIADNAFILRGGRSVVKKFDWKRWVNAMAEELYRLLLTVAFVIQTTAVSIMPVIGKPLALLHLCWLYALYSFEYRWNLEGWKLETRLLFFERRWAYFAGFGFPSALLTVLFPNVFVSSGLFALIFPLLIILAIVAKPVTHFKTPKVSATSSSTTETNGHDAPNVVVNPGRLPIFKYAKKLNRAVLHLIKRRTTSSNNSTQ